jgi:hypothetical protein
MTETERADRLRKHYFPRWARDAYAHDGWRIVEPGSPEGAALGLHGVDWHPDTFAAKRGRDRVELPLLRARYPGHGAFGRLVDRLREQGYRVTVSAPLMDFRDHLLRAGWQIIDAGEHGEIWSPPER